MANTTCPVVNLPKHVGLDIIAFVRLEETRETGRKSRVRVRNKELAHVSLAVAENISCI